MASHTKVPLARNCYDVHFMSISLVVNSETTVFNYDKKRKAIIDLLLGQLLRTGVTTAVLITIIGFVFWETFHDQLLIIWVIVGYIICLPRFYIYKVVRHLAPPEKLYLWLELTIVITLFISGLYWGITAWLYFIPENPTIFLYAAISVMGVVASALPAFSALPYIWFVFATTILALAAIKLAFLGFWELTILAFVNLVGLAPLSLYLGKQIEKSITLDFRNAELLEEVGEAKEAAEKANLAKSQFLASASHDLRQPLHAQGILLEALKLRLHNSEHSELLNKTIQSNEALHSLFDALLEISQLDAGTMAVNLSHQPINQICQQVVNEYQLIAQQKGLSLSLHSHDCTAVTDPILINRILRNLVSNAVKFTRSGEINVAVTCDNTNAYIIVSDTGIGIPESQQEHIFDEYYQLDNKARDRSKGIGLGLALVRRMCQLLKHDIRVESKVNKGTQFHLTLPLGNKNEVTVKQEQTISGSIENLNILIIDDEQPILDAMTVMLTDWSCHPQGFTTLDDAELAIDTGSCRPDIIISDYRLANDVTGLDVIHRLHHKLGKEVPALLVSGDTDPVLLERIHKHNFYLLHKPLKAFQLKKVIRILLEDAQS